MSADSGHVSNAGERTRQATQSWVLKSTNYKGKTEYAKSAERTEPKSRVT